MPKSENVFFLNFSLILPSDSKDLEEIGTMVTLVALDGQMSGIGWVEDGDREHRD